MFLKLEDYNTGWIGLKIAIKTNDIDILIQNLELLKDNPSQHFHISSNFEGETGVGDIEIYVDDESPENMQLLSQAIEPNR